MNLQVIVAFSCILLCATAAARVIRDLTHVFDEHATKWPSSGFDVKINYYYKLTQLTAKDYGDFWLAFNFLEFYEHQGTHIDAPSHFGKGRQDMHEIPPERLIGPGVVIDVVTKAAENPDYVVTVDDIKNYEKRFGTIPPNAIVMMNSGWAHYYPIPEKVFGTNMINDSSTFHFPGWDIDAVRMLLQERQVSVVGVDTPSTDPGTSRTFPAHVYLQNNNVPLLEYVANLDTIPQNGTTIVLGNIKTRGGTGGPTRIFAIIEDKKEDCATGTATYNFLGTVTFLSAVLGALLLV